MQLDFFCEIHLAGLIRCINNLSGTNHDFVLTGAKTSQINLHDFVPNFVLLFYFLPGGSLVGCKFCTKEIIL